MSSKKKLSFSFILFPLLILAAMAAHSEAIAAQLQLGWADNSSNEDGFKIERKTGTSGVYSQIAIVGPNTTSYTDTSLADATTYCYRVRAYNTAGDSAYSNEVCASTPLASFTLSLTKAGTGSGTVTSSPAGINCGTTCSATYNSGTSVTLTATAAAGSSFTGWSGACTGTGTCTVTMSAAQSATATFSLQTFPLTLTKAGTGSGTVTSSPAGINCGATCSATYNSGTSIVLTATPAAGSTFAGWSGTGCTTGTVSLSANTTCTATFNLQTFSLTVAKAGTGTGTVTSSPAGINCGATCSGTYNSGTSIALTATPAADSSFAGWSGTGCTTGTVSLSANTTCTATFNLQTFSLTVAKAGTGTGTVTSSPAGINCGATCSATYNSGTSIALTATPAADSSFAGWSGTGCTTGTVSLSANTTCTATFNLQTFSLTVAKAGTGTGTVTSSPAGINCGATCSGTYNSGTSIALTATPAADSSFAGWSGMGCTSGTVSLSANTTCTATFNLLPPATFSLTVAKAGTGSGTVTSSPAGINCGTTCSASYSIGTVVTLTASPAAGSTFADWSGDADCADGSVTMDASKSCTATFNLQTLTLSVNLVSTITNAGTGSGSVTSSPAGINCGTTCTASYSSGTVVTLTATPASGSTFTGWSGGCSGTGNCALSLTTNISVSATFAPQSFALTVNKTGRGTVSSNPSGINCGQTCSGSYPSNTSITLTPTPDPNFSFLGWSGGGCSGTGGCTVALSANAAVTATFSYPIPSAIGVFRPSTGEWLLDLNGNGTFDDCNADACMGPFGRQGDRPIPGAWTNTEAALMGFFHSSTATWYMDLNGNGVLDGCEVDTCRYVFGQPGDQPVVGDWTGSGITRIGVFRPSTRKWYLDINGSGHLDSCKIIDVCSGRFGLSGDLPVVGDWTGSGKTRIGVFHPSTGRWTLDLDGNRQIGKCTVDRCISSFGLPGDFPVVGDWNGDGKDKIGVFRPSTGEWFLDLNGNGVFDGCSVDACLSFGQPGDLPVVGKW